MFEGFRDFISEHGWLEIACLVVAVLIEIYLQYDVNTAKKVPNNYYLLYAFTFCEAYIVASFCLKFDPMIVF